MIIYYGNKTQMQGKPLNARKIKKLLKKNKRFNKNEESLYVIRFNWKENKEKGD